jgi:hypothetical protein
MDRYRQRQTGGTSGSSLGWRAFWQSERTFPGVSFPSSVVRSTIDTAVVSPHTLDFFLMLRVANFATPFLDSDLVNRAGLFDEAFERRPRRVRMDYLSGIRH